MIQQIEKNGDCNPDDFYLDHVADVPLLTGEEEIALAKRIRDGDVDARQHLIRANLRLVVGIAQSRRFRRSPTPLFSRIAGGNLGLIRAVDNFDPDEGTRFSTYATYAIRRAIIDVTIDEKVVHVPKYMVILLAKFDRLQRENGGLLSDEELADRMEITLEKLQQVKDAATHAPLHSKDFGWSGDAHEETDGHLAFMASVPDETDEPFRDMEDADLKAALLRMIDELDPRDRTIMRLRFGLEDGTEYKMKDIAKRVGIGRDVVSKRINITCRMIKQKMDL